MKLNRSAMVAAVGIAVVGLIGVMHLHGQQGPAPPEPVRVAVVNVLKVINEVAEAADIRAALAAARADFQREHHERKQKLESIKDDMEILRQDAVAARKQLQEKLEQEAIHLRVWTEFVTRKNDVELIVRFEALYRKVLDEIAAIAERDGYDLVLYNDYGKDINVQTEKQLQAAILLRKCVYVKDGLDITDQVIQQMDNKHAAGEN